MLHLSHAACQTAADFPEAFGLSGLAEEHGDKMLPRIERFGKSLRLVTIDELMKIFPINKHNHLTELDKSVVFSVLSDRSGLC